KLAKTTPLPRRGKLTKKQKLTSPPPAAPPASTATQPAVAQKSSPTIPSPIAVAPPSAPPVPTALPAVSAAPAVALLSPRPTPSAAFFPQHRNLSSLVSASAQPHQPVSASSGPPVILPRYKALSSTAMKRVRSKSPRCTNKTTDSSTFLRAKSCSSVSGSLLSAAPLCRLRSQISPDCYCST